LRERTFGVRTRQASKKHDRGSSVREGEEDHRRKMGKKKRKNGKPTQRFKSAGGGAHSQK